MLPENPNKKISFDNGIFKEIYLGGGCFWGTDARITRTLGVHSTEVGYADGKTENPTYRDVCHGDTGHVEVVRVKYDTTKITLKCLLEEFFNIINPTTLNRQGDDVGVQYRSGIYYTDIQDKEVIEEVVANEQCKYEESIVTEVKPLENYYKAEEYHQNYVEKNPGGYCHIKF